MRRHRRHRPLRSIGLLSFAAVVALLASTVLAVAPVAPAAAVVPGQNGLLAFQSDRDGDWEIYVANPDGSGQVALTDNAANDTLPAWSPDGTRIAFTSNRDGNNEIYVMDADGAGQTRLTNNSASDSIPAWSPDGTQLAFNTNRDGYQQVYVMGADGSGPTNRSASLVADMQPAWSPDGTRIAFARDAPGQLDVYVMDADGTDQTRLTYDTAHDALPAWSPDGSTIAFANNSNGGGLAHFDVYLMTPAGAPLGNLTSTYDYTETRPAWSPDGTQLAYAGSTTATGPYDLWVMDADGSNPQKVVESTGSDYWPDWQPQAAATGTITVTQDSRPDKAQDFAYSVSGAGLFPFSLDDDANGTLPSTITYEGLDAGTYTVTQAAPSRWSLTELSCSDGSSVDLTQRRASIVLGHGEDVTCAFVDVWRRPDASVNTASTGSFKGDGVYATAVTTAQTKTASVARGATRTFYVRLDNDGGGTESLTLRGVASGSSGYTVKYKLGTENITDQVVSGSFQTDPLAPGASVLVKVKVTATTAAAAGSARNVDLTVRSTAIPSQRDVVRVRAVRS